MSNLLYEIEHFNPYSPRAHLTANVPCQLGDQPQVVCVDKSFHREPTEPKDRERAVRNSRTTSHFLRRLSLRLHIIHHGEEQAENSSTRGNRPMADSANSLAHPLSIPEIIGG